MKAATNISLKSRSTLTLSDFKGVDFTSSPYRTSAYRAADAANLIYENGMNRKRKGWRQRYFFGTLPSANPDDHAEINGIFHYKTATRDVILIHNGTDLTEIDQQSGVQRSLLSGASEEAEVPSGRSQFFMNKEKCYIVSENGDIWVYGSWDDGETYEAKPLADTAYVPTTTISIGWTEAEDSNVAFYESPNVLTPWRKNQIRTQENSDTYYGPFTYELDAPIEPESDVLIEWIGFGMENKEVLARNGTKEEGHDYTNLGLTENLEGRTCLITPSGQITGFLTWGDLRPAYRSNATITLFFGLWRVPSDGSDNMAVTFCVDSRAWKYQKEMITRCSFGIFFGSHGNTDRLFLSGNSAYPNQVFFSGFDDLSYFPDINYLMAGSDHVPVNGFVRLNDNALAVLKSESDIDSTVFYVTGTLQNQYDESGNLSAGKAVFTIAGGGVGEGNLSPYTAVNLAGDALFLSTGGVFAISLTENITTNARNVRERSWSINGSLRRHSGADAVGIVFENRYYLSMDGVCYLADAAHKYTRNGNDSDTGFQYEWWYWENLPARVWAIVDGILWFGTSDGRVCSLDGTEYRDSTFYELVGSSYDVKENAVYYNAEWEAAYPEYAPREGDILRFSAAASAEQRVYAKLAHVVPCGDVWCFSEKESGEFWEGRCLCLGTAYREAKEEEGNVVAVQAVKVDRGEGTVGFRQPSDFPFSVYEDGSADVFLPLNEEDLALTRVASGHFQVALPSAPQTPLRLARMGPYLELPDARLTQFAVVCARWQTPYLDLGSGIYQKTLLRLSVTAGEESGRFSFGYQTKRANDMQAVRGVDSFSWNRISFARFGFGNAFASSHTVRMRVRDINYIRFRFLSEEAEEMTVDSLTALYKINGMNQGVK